LVCSAVAFAAKPVPPSPYTVLGDEPTDRIARPGVVGEFDAATGAATMLSAPGFHGDAGDPVATARAYLAFDAARLGISGATDEAALPVRFVRAGKAATVVRFEQRLDGIKVHDGEIAVAVGPRGDVSYVASSYRAALGAPVNAVRLDGAAALDAALAHLGGAKATTLALEPRVYAAADGARHVWRALIDPRGEPEGEWEILVDAESGAILRAEDKLLYANTNGKVFDPDPLSSAGVTYGTTGYTDGNDADTPQLTAQTFDRTLFDLAFAGGIYSLNGPWAHCVDWDAPAGTCPTTMTSFTDTRFSDNFEGVNCYHHIDSQLRYLNVTLGLTVHAYQYGTGTEYDPRGFSGADNSSYSSGTGRLRFGEGGVDDAEDADVVIHELGHGIHDWVTGGHLSQTQGLSEGVGDYFAVSYSRAYSNQWTAGQAQYDWVFSWDGHNTFWSGRVTNWDDTHTYPAGLVGQVHTDGQFWSSCSLNSWERIGRDAMDAAMVEGLAMTGSSTNQATAAQAVLTAAWNMGFSPSYVQVIQIEYTSGGCQYGVSHPADANRIDFDGFEHGNTSQWTSVCPPTCG
ncbi:MAG: M36 family metallopeptidase, partial [Holophagales bacterium]|nr:M36 family metallopeptidase [Holophagales bacterium]